MATLNEILSLVLPSSGQDNHVTLRNHTIAVGQVIRSSPSPITVPPSSEPVAELGIDVGYVRKTKARSAPKQSQTETGAISIVVAAVGPRGKQPRVWASAQPRTSKLHAEMTGFLARSGYGEEAKVQVITDAAKDLADVADKLPQHSRWMLDWAHIGRNLWRVDRAISPLAYGQLTPEGSPFELWDLFVRFRSYVWTGQTKKWQEAGQRLYELLKLRQNVDPDEALADRARQARRHLNTAMVYLEANIDSLIDYRLYQQRGRRISTGYVESSINRVIGRRMCKDQHMRWSRDGADGVVQVRVALQNQEFDEHARTQFWWSDGRRMSWPWMQASHPF